MMKIIQQVLFNHFSFHTTFQSSEMSLSCPKSFQRVILTLADWNHRILFFIRSQTFIKPTQLDSKSPFFKRRPSLFK